MGIIANFQVFTQAYVLTVPPNMGPGDSLMFLVIYLFRNAFAYLKMGYACTLAWILFAIILMLTILQLRLARRLGSLRGGRVIMQLSAGKKFIVYTLLVLLSIIIFLPFYGMVITSFKTEQQIQDVSSLGGMLIASPVRLKNYSDVFRYIPFLRYYWNTFYVTVLSIIGCVASCSLVAYGFARFKWPGRDIVFVIMLSTMMLPPQVTIIPIFIMFSKIGWVDSFKPLWVPPYFGIPFSIFLLRQFLMGIPKDLEEAAKIDGCTPLGIFWRVMVPLIKPALLAVMVFEFLWAWNDFVNPLIYIHDANLMTLSLAMFSFQWLHRTEWHLLMAAATMMTVPAIAVFFMAQKYFIEGITLTGMKG